MDICLHRFCEWVEGFLLYRDIKLSYYLFNLPYVLVFLVWVLCVCVCLSNFRPNLDDGNELEEVFTTFRSAERWQGSGWEYVDDLSMKITTFCWMPAQEKGINGKVFHYPT